MSIQNQSLPLSAALFERMMRSMAEVQTNLKPRVQQKTVFSKYSPSSDEIGTLCVMSRKRTPCSSSRRTKQPVFTRQNSSRQSKERYRPIRIHRRLSLLKTVLHRIEEEVNESCSSDAGSIYEIKPEKVAERNFALITMESETWPTTWSSVETEPDDTTDDTVEILPDELFSLRSCVIHALIEPYMVSVINLSENFCFSPKEEKAPVSPASLTTDSPVTSPKLVETVSRDEFVSMAKCSISDLLHRRAVFDWSFQASVEQARQMRVYSSNQASKYL